MGSCAVGLSRFEDESIINGLSREDTMLILTGLSESNSMLEQTYPYPIFTSNIYGEKKEDGDVTVGPVECDEDLLDSLQVRL